MATKKLNPKNPAKDSTKKADTKVAERKTAAGSHRFRKTSSIRTGH